MLKKIQRILISQPAPATSRSPYHILAEKYGLDLTFRPLFAIESVTARAFRDQKIDPLEYTAVIFTSKTMVDHFFGLLKEVRVELPATYKYYCISDAVAGYLQKYIVLRKRRLYIPETNGCHDEFLKLILKHKKECFLVPIIDGHKETLFTTLEEHNVNFTRGVVSTIRFEKFTPEELKSYDLILFFSPNGVSSLFHNAPSYVQGEQLLGCLGEGTHCAMKEAGLRVDVLAPTAEFPSMVAALDATLNK